jgi:CubicO group peptidase (beta-lactamase class C family)
MTKRPPGPAKADLSNWRTPLHSRWAFRQVDQIIPTAPIENDPSDISEMVEANERSGSLFPKLLLNAMRTDAVVILRNGKLWFEWYARGNDAHTPHILMSATKAVIGLLAGMLHETGDLDLDANVSTYVPEIATTPYHGATMRNLLDMRASIALEPEQQRAHEIAANWEPAAGGEQDADLVSFLQNLTAAHPAHGGPFSYNSANTDLLGWAIERATGQTIAALLVHGYGNRWAPRTAPISRSTARASRVAPEGSAPPLAILPASASSSLTTASEVPGRSSRRQ